MPDRSPFFSLFKNAVALVMDVDGVLTDGSLLVTESGEQLRTMNIRDGYAIQLAIRKGMPVAVITGGTSAGVVKRLRSLGVEHVFSGIDDKAGVLKQLAKETHLDLARTIYIGDDLPDLGCLQLCGIPCCPQDAALEIREACAYISPFDGGKGCVRDILEKVLKLQAKWH